MDIRLPGTAIVAAAPAAAGPLRARASFPRRSAALSKLSILLLAALLIVSGLCFMSSGGLVTGQNSSGRAAQPAYGVQPMWELLGQSPNASGTVSICSVREPAPELRESKIGVDEVFGFVVAREGTEARTGEADAGRVPSRAQETPKDTALPHQLLRRPPPHV